jgi:uncharacterized damage-inducible protein DinB
VAKSDPQRPDAETSRPEVPDAERRPTWRKSVVRGMLSGIRQVSRDVASVALGRLAAPESDAAKDTEVAKPDSGSEQQTRRLNMLHTITEQLRGAADDYVAAKLDEIEARVDRKLGEIEERIDEKIVDLHRQLAEMRDQEWRHRLRLLKITLIFTVLVALLSLLYKWVQMHWLS